MTTTALSGHFQVTNFPSYNSDRQPAILQQAVISGCDNSDQRMVEVDLFQWFFFSASHFSFSRNVSLTGNDFRM